jgi:hypothetical protein
VSLGELNFGASDWILAGWVVLENQVCNHNYTTPANERGPDAQCTPDPEAAAAVGRSAGRSASPAVSLRRAQSSSQALYGDVPSPRNVRRACPRERCAAPTCAGGMGNSRRTCSAAGPVHGLATDVSGRQERHPEVAVQADVDDEPLHHYYALQQHRVH